MKTRNTLNWIGTIVGVLGGLMWIWTALAQVIYQRDPQYFMLGIPAVIVVVLAIFGCRTVAVGSAALIVGLLMTAGAAGIPFTAAGNVSRDSGWLGFVLVFAAPLLLSGVLFIIAYMFNKTTSQRALMRLALTIGALVGATWAALGVWGLVIVIPREELRGQDAATLALGACILALTLLSWFRPGLGGILLIALAVAWLPFWLYVPSLPPVPQEPPFAIAAGVVLWVIFSAPLAVTVALFLRAARCTPAPAMPAPAEGPQRS